MIFLNLLGNRIRKMRQEKNITQQELSQKAQISQTLISRYETGKIVPPLTKLEQIAYALGISVIDIVK